MKIIMYHYVRESLKQLPNFRYLHIENFKKQLDFFEKEFGFVTYDEFLYLKENPLFCNKLKNKILLTFDDGLKDHYNYVFNELVKRKILGIFFVPTRIFKQKKALNVHRIHYLLGKMGGGILLNTAYNIIKPNILKKSSLKLFKNYYQELNDDKNTKDFKLLFNYFIKPKYKEKILDEMVARFWNDEEIFNNLYLNKDELKIMSENDMLIASHSSTHLSFKTLDICDQKYELQTSISFLNSFIKQPIQLFSYPYGENTAYSKRWLKNNNFDFAFNSIPSKDIEYKDLINNPFALHRYDCNEFIYGKASFG
ncbi:polysaccharide deacetylase family protein [Campylobacter jejuni]|uniref:polysaccharide deacetylase family protein n=2 Tax=Campylobacter jejuni TaxID=197 RepID=UPI000FAB42F3|nr:polysaccharide deacetylase family protein [Campylobacter jejuni]EAH5333677.1 polysaccharide deacetylase [Campylobacter jejuni]EAI4845872.1 polysaccharide deacetylase [Campylobacter jejuni]EAI6345705.1 polysaccharide deacetylase [Campylobacter jejuni]EAI8594877.1 polysaccharide deacetylase [Campylobacter jejuni]EAJ0167902.1 polysaccharide deacetylase [Campylobacter jejuni]